MRRPRDVAEDDFRKPNTMKKQQFVTTLAPLNASICGGFGSGPGCDPRKEADAVFGGNVPGAWLTCYMLRRFGWPNSGSDDYKELCAWTLTTPMAGLYLGVSPYLGDSMNLSFNVRFNKKVQRLLYADPLRDAFFRRKEKAIRLWWRSAGCKLYMWGFGKASGDEDVLVHKFCDAHEDGMVLGLWKREARHAKTHPKKMPSPKRFIMLDWWLGDFISKIHPEVKLPGITKREKGARQRKTRFQIQVAAALRAAMRDLLRPTNVRDLSFSPFGDIERTAAAVKHYRNQKQTGYFDGAGHAPAYWYRHGRGRGGK